MARDAGERYCPNPANDPGPRGIRCKSRNNSKRRVAPVRLRYRSDQIFSKGESERFLHRVSRCATDIHRHSESRFLRRKIASGLCEIR